MCICNNDLTHTCAHADTPSLIHKHTNCPLHTHAHMHTQELTKGQAMEAGLKTCKEDVSAVTAERNTYEALRDGALEELLIATSDIQCKEVALQKLEQELQVCVAVLQSVAVCCRVLRCVVVCCTVLHCVAVCQAHKHAKLS